MLKSLRLFIKVIAQKVRKSATCSIKNYQLFELHSSSLDSAVGRGRDRHIHRRHTRR